MDTGNLASGKSYEDSCAHVVELYEEKMFNEFMAFVSLTKFNEGGINKLITLQAKDGDINGDDRWKTVAREKSENI